MHNFIEIVGFLLTVIGLVLQLSPSTLLFAQELIRIFVVKPLRTGVHWIQKRIRRKL